MSLKDVELFGVNEQEMVRDFHVKHDFPREKPLMYEPSGRYVNMFLWAMSKILLLLVRLAKKVAYNADRKGDTRLLRASLIIEEVGETCEALRSKKTFALADGLSDTLYVVYGTGVTYNIPLHYTFAEVHKSNMTKALCNRKVDPRLRNKGSSFVAPNFERSIIRGRKAPCPTCTEPLEDGRCINALCRRCSNG